MRTEAEVREVFRLHTLGLTGRDRPAGRGGPGNGAGVDRVATLVRLPGGDKNSPAQAVAIQHQ